MRRTPLLLAVALVLPFGGSAFADMLSLKDGRFIDGRKIDKVEKGYEIHYENGKVLVPKALVEDYFRTNDTGEFVPQTDEEKAKVEEGLLPWRGGWIPKTRRTRLIKKEIQARKLRLEQQQARRKWRNREQVKTKVFHFQHTLPDDLFEEFKSLFETYYTVFKKEWKIKPSREFGKAKVNIYHNEEYYQQVSGAPSGVVGYYVPAARDLHFFYDRDRHRFTIDVMLHECNHMLTHMINPGVWYPAWVGEGMAEYYGASEWNPRTKKMKVGGIQSARLCVLWSQVKVTEREKKKAEEKGEDPPNKWQGLRDLINCDRINAIQYSWAWSLCHFLLSDPQYSKNFKKYFVALGKSKKVKRSRKFAGFVAITPAEQIKWLKKMLKVDSLETLEKEWHDYIKTELALDKVELDWAGAGWIMSLYGERDKAKEFFEKAVSEGEQSGYVYYSYAKLLMNEGKTEQASEMAQKATEVDPLHARAWMVRGQCFLRKGKKDEGMRLIDLAMELDPDDTEIWLRKAWAEDEMRDD